MNEAGNIHPLINEICAIFAGRHFEIIYIDDASTDSTADELAVLPKARCRNCACCAISIGSGQSAAIRSGLLRARGVLIGVLDGDGQNVPADFPALEAAVIEAGKQGQLAMAAGIRQQRNDSALRLLASRAAKWVRAQLAS